MLTKGTNVLRVIVNNPFKEVFMRKKKKKKEEEEKEEEEEGNLQILRVTFCKFCFLKSQK